MGANKPLHLAMIVFSVALGHVMGGEGGKALAWGWAAARLAWVSTLSPAHPDKQLGAKRAPRQISLASLGWSRVSEKVSQGQLA